MASDDVQVTVDTSVTAEGPLAEMFAGMNINQQESSLQAEATSAATDVTSEQQQSQSSKRRADEEGRPTPSESVAGRQIKALRLRSQGFWLH